MVVWAIGTLRSAPFDAAAVAVAMKIACKKKAKNTKQKEAEKKT